MMWRLRLALVAPLAAAPAGAQSVDLIEERLTDVRSGFFELGPFYATPALRFSGGYDSNALSTPEAQADIAALLGPGIRLALPMGSNAFFDMFQEVDFVYYKNNVDLRRIFDITRLGGGWGWAPLSTSNQQRVSGRDSPAYHGVRHSSRDADQPIRGVDDLRVRMATPTKRTLRPNAIEDRRGCDR